jgi:hypothetical protein
MKRSKIAGPRRLNRQVRDHERRVVRSDQRFTSSLQQLLLGLAPPLLAAGITPAYFSDLATRAFVRAAADVSTCRNGRVNGSRVAVLTSLRRAEVKRWLTQCDNSEKLYRTRQPRTKRVIVGWRTDRRYLDRDGLPRQLPMDGRSASFTSLVKAFAGDVTPRAVLEELRRLNAIRETGRVLELTSERQQRNRSDSKSTRELFNVLLDGVAAATQRPKNAPRSLLRRISLEAADIVDLELILERASNSANAFLDGLHRSLELPTRPPRKIKTKMGHQLAITVVIRSQPAVRARGARQ